ncbi:MAG: transcriptional repressor LexA [Peptococcaceae bacterium]|nr:transcriptional repressor LexA [Peptococcaceae bacterium]
MKDLSQRQKQILEYIKNHHGKKGYPPSVREIGEAIGLASSSTVHFHLNILEGKGYLRRDPAKPRAIEILDPTGDNTMPRVAYAPIVGRVTAGIPILADENIEDYFPIPENLAPDSDVFFLRVQGESMIEAGILDRDLVLVRQQAAAQNGDIVVAMLADDLVTVKRFYKETDRVRLQPENAAMEPIYTQDIDILGRVVGVFRTLM